jgi:phosphoribosyl-ATP pyrophosphohydrolase/phosphoribosyl-AMP cyclohydrolase
MSFSTIDPATIAFQATDGLVPAIVQDADRGSVLMLGYMNRDAVAATLARRRVVFFSRSRQRLWEKGETSGHTLELVGLLADCDRDTLLVLARPRGPACHTGTRTCFGDEPHAGVESIEFLARLERIVEQRIAERTDGSYTARLFAGGPRRLAQKVGEEGVEVALAGAADDPGQLLGESADLLYHLIVLLRGRGFALSQVVRELESRHAALT